MRGFAPWQEVQRQAAERAPRAFLVFFALETLSLAYDTVTYPERLPVALAVWVVCSAIAAGGVLGVRQGPARAVEILVGCTVAASLLIVAYHAATDAAAEWCLLVLTALLCTVTLFFSWGWRAQLVACSGACLAYPAFLLAGAETLNPPLTGLTYLACVVGLSAYAAEMNARQLGRSLELARHLAERERRLRSYLDQALIGIGVVSADGAWRELNAALCRMVGRRADELIGRPWTDLLEPDDVGLGSTALRRGGEAGTIVDVRLRGGDGRSVDACLAARSFRAPDGTLEETVLMVVDISERKRVERDLALARDLAQAAYHSKSEFLAQMSHELRTPMNIIFGMTEMAMEESSSSGQREVLDRTRRAARSLLVLVDEVLDVSRIETGRVRLQPREFALRPWLQDVVEPMRTLADAKGLDLGCEVEEDVADRVIGDPDRLRQILVNLIGNGIKFTDRGYVRVRVSPVRGIGEGEAIEFCVEDSGRGIPPEQRARIFEPFVQAAPPAESGVGLGLAISSQLVEIMGGRIWVESEVGRGSRFHFTAPGVGRFAA